MKKLEEKINLLNNMKYQSMEDIDEEPPTELDKKMIELSQEIWIEILKIAKEENIIKPEEFDRKYPIMEFGLQNWIEEYLNQLFYCSEMDESYIEKETQALDEVLEQFDLEQDLRQEYEMFLIRDLHILGKEKEANQNLKAWLKEYPEEEEGFEIQCEWELEKDNPDMEKVAEILDQAEDNGVYIRDEEIYEKVINYYRELGNEEASDYYESLLEFANNAEIQETYEEFQEQMLEELLEELKQMANDKVQKDKKYEEYIKDKKWEELVAFFALGSIALGNEGRNPIQMPQNEIKQFLLDNREEILRNNLSYVPETVWKTLEEMKETSLIEIQVETDKVVPQIEPFIFLKQIGIAFAEYQYRKVIFHIPEIKKIKELLKKEEIRNSNQEFNEKADCIRGMCEVYGAIKAKKAYRIFEKMFETTKEEFARLLVLTKVEFPTIEIEINHKSKNVEMIYLGDLQKKFAKEIVKQNKDLKEYTKEEYIYYGKGNYIENTQGYQDLKKELEGIPLEELDMLEVIMTHLVEPYLLMKKTGEQNADNILREMLEMVCNEEEVLTMYSFNVDNIVKAIKQMGKEVPLWIAGK